MPKDYRTYLWIIILTCGALFGASGAFFAFLWFDPGTASFSHQYVMLQTALTVSIFWWGVRLVGLTIDYVSDLSADDLPAWEDSRSLLGSRDEVS